MQKRFISLFLATAAVILACCGIFYVNLPEETGAEQISTVLDEDFTFSLQKAKDSLSLCAAAGYPVTLTAKLERKNYESIEYFQYENSAKSDNKAGLVLALKDNTLLAVIRGTKDEEWYSNFYIGDSAEHAGFSLAADLVISNIESYLRSRNISPKDTEIFLTGHSRGAAVANIAAARLIDKNSFKSLSACTFACPNTTTLQSADDLKYKTIVNIINPQDFICYIPLPQWDYTRFGQTVELPDSSTEENFSELYEEMEKAYLADTGTPLKDFPNKGQDVRDIISYLADIAPTPEDYTQKEIAVGSFRLTLYDYMMKLAAVMNNENPLLHGLFMLSCKSIPEVCPITEFVFSGMSEKDLQTTTSLNNTPVVANHMHEAYFAWLNTLPEAYFTDKLNN